MMKLALSMSLAAMTLFAVAAETPAPVAEASAKDAASAADAAKRPRRKMTKEEREKRLEKFRLRRVGGYVYDRRKQHGSISFVNRQTRVPTATINEVVASLTSFTHAEITVTEDAKPYKAAELAGCALPEGVNGLVQLVDAPELASPTLVSPEGHWAVVNVAALAKDNPPDVQLLSRTVKSLNRVFGLTFGAADSRTEHCAMHMAKDLATLDAIPCEQLSPETFAKINYHLSLIGVTPCRVATYEEACKEGWAAAPTNDIQKAVWDRVHAIPQTPMKIEFDPKKGR